MLPFRCRVGAALIIKLCEVLVNQRLRVPDLVFDPVLFVGAEFPRSVVLAVVSQELQLPIDDCTHQPGFRGSL